MTKVKLPDWQSAWMKATGVTPCAPTEKVRAMQFLHDTGIGYKLPGGIGDTLRQMVASGAVRESNDDGA